MILFPETLLAAHHIISGKKVTGIFNFRKLELFLKVFISRFIFQKLFFLRLFYLDSYTTLGWSETGLEWSKTELGWTASKQGWRTTKIGRNLGLQLN